MPDLSQYKFTATHEWVELKSDSARVGITDHAQAQLGDVIFLELPEVGRTLQAGESFGVIESVKAASDLYAPISGTVSAVNGELAEHPERINQDAYGSGWLVELSETDVINAKLMTEDEYNAQVH